MRSTAENGGSAVPQTRAARSSLLWVKRIQTRSRTATDANGRPAAANTGILFRRIDDELATFVEQHARPEERLGFIFVTDGQSDEPESDLSLPELGDQVLSLGNGLYAVVSGAIPQRDALIGRANDPTRPVHQDSAKAQGKCRRLLAPSIYFERTPPVLVNLRERLVEGISEHIPNAYLIGHRYRRLPGHVSIGISGQEPESIKLMLALDQAGFSVSTGSAVEANAIPIAKEKADLAMDAAACIGCGACVAMCPNASAALFTAAKISHLGLLPQGQAERDRRAIGMVLRMTREDFGQCTNMGQCEAVCPKSISIETIARMHRDYISASVSSRQASSSRSSTRLTSAPDATPTSASD